MAQQFLNRGVQWSKHKRIATLQRRRQRSVFSAYVKVSLTKDDGTETINIRRIERRTPGKTHLNHLSCRLMHAREARGQGGGVVCNHQVVRPQKLDKRTARHMNEISLCINDKKFRVAGTLYCCISGYHVLYPCHLWQSGC